MDGHPRYIIGIDLGTTNCAVAYVDTDSTRNPALASQSFAVPQLVAEGHVEAREVLPSFCYLPAEYEFPAGALKLPWEERSEKVRSKPCVGVFARERGGRVPTRLVQSAKSWLCHAGADRGERILPREAADPEQRMSPVEASAAYLRHLRQAWNHRVAKSDPAKVFEEQEIVLTIPASFDEVARGLTVEAARLAGCQRLTLLEEPQAAFYAWLARHRKELGGRFETGQRILVCDVGGGTTDFSLIEVTGVGESLDFQRMAVGEHLLLGGDNMDHALTHYLEQKILAGSGQKELPIAQVLELHHQARSAKEVLLQDDAPERYVVTLHGKGTSLVGGSLSADIEREELRTLLSEGFFGLCSLDEVMERQARSAIRSAGLPYEEEASIIKQIGRFLMCSGGERPDYVLFNGGTMTPPLFRHAVLRGIGNWFDGTDPEELPSAQLDLAVSRGAAYYGKVRRGLGVRIGGGSPRTFYLGVNTGSGEKQAMVLIPRGSCEGQCFSLQQRFVLQANQAVAFPLYSSNVRLNDALETLVAIDSEEMHQLPPIHTILRFGKKETQSEVIVTVHAELTELGTVSLWLEAEQTDHRWSLEFQLRSVSGQDDSLMTQGAARQDETFDVAYLKEAQDLVHAMFEGRSDLKPGKLFSALEELLESRRAAWPLSVLRQLADSLLEVAAQRGRSEALRCRWWNCLGFCMRPGAGYPLDDHRLRSIWKCILQELNGAVSTDLDLQLQICFRRLAAGLNKGQQLQLINRYLPRILGRKGKDLQRPKGMNDYSYQELVRLLGSLERAPQALKKRLGEALLQRIQREEALPAEYWALARIGNRQPLSGGLADVVPRDLADSWVQRLLASDTDGVDFAIAHLARRTEQREIDLPQETIERVSQRLSGGALQSLLSESRDLSGAEQTELLGDSLPAGLTLTS